VTVTVAVGHEVAEAVEDAVIVPDTVAVTVAVASAVAVFAAVPVAPVVALTEDVEEPEKVVVGVAVCETDADTEFVARNIEAQTKARSLAELSRLDIDLHHYVVTCSGNLRLLQLWEPLRWQWEAHLAEIYRRQKGDDFIPEKETIKAHQNLLKALAEGTPAEASEAMMHHILFNLRWAK
jgi:hypothetical protein